MRTDRFRRRSRQIPLWPLALIAAGLVSGAAVTGAVSRASDSLPVELQPATPAEATVPPGREALPNLAGQPGQAAAPPGRDALPDLAGQPGQAAAPKRPPAPRDWNAFRAQLEAYVAQQDGTYGVCIIDIETGRIAGVNSDTAFPAASTFKLPMAMYILSEVEAGNASLDEEIAYTGADYEDGTGILQEGITEGETVRVGRLVDLAITHSDNIAANMLLHRFGREKVFAYMDKLGGTVTELDGGITATTPREMAEYMRQAHGSKTLRSPVLRGFLEDLLATTAFSNRTAAGVPSGVKVEHKIGTLPGVVNDVALVFAPRRTFVLSVFSVDVGEDVASDVITEITRQAYEFESSLDPSIIGDLGVTS